MMTDDSRSLAGILWSVTDLLRGDFKRSEYGKVILPFIVLRRLDWALEPTREQVLDAISESVSDEFPSDEALRRLSGHPFYNISQVHLHQVLTNPERAACVLHEYLHGFSANVQSILNRFAFKETIERLDGVGLLHMVTGRFLSLDLG
ncbi:type I restriction-modification system subunit M N-terminal domain-containing protein [Actinomadura bangladeshensis]|uniref:N6 adenine-specific DNA methyltransferase N-terminal domain-containing protein n=1 Tax=Actinomadura bangladeshensis TaxID=453573 RepID=A0A6L9QA85_9ACTN|nr:type I restriction-modification system subunit M N-terminal domain-containing protein [Actinomadura bangladeshensis]NEA21978.1 hypothetical protein [Actinomadura bangladeshensis]